VTCGQAGWSDTNWQDYALGSFQPKTQPIERRCALCPLATVALSFDINPDIYTPAPWTSQRARAQPAYSGAALARRRNLINQGIDPDTGAYLTDVMGQRWTPDGRYNAAVQIANRRDSPGTMAVDTSRRGLQAMSNGQVVPFGTFGQNPDAKPLVTEGVLQAQDDRKANLRRWHFGGFDPENVTPEEDVAAQTARAKTIAASRRNWEQIFAARNPGGVLNPDNLSRGSGGSIFRGGMEFDVPQGLGPNRSATPYVPSYLREPGDSSIAPSVDLRHPASEAAPPAPIRRYKRPPQTFDPPNWDQSAWDPSLAPEVGT
jgi:hypothetical protein